MFKLKTKCVSVVANSIELMVGWENIFGLTSKGVKAFSTKWGRTSFDFITFEDYCLDLCLLRMCLCQ